MAIRDQGGDPPSESGIDSTEVLDFLNTRHASLEQRGISVVTTTSTLVTLLLALSGLAGSQSNFAADKNELWLPVALVFLVLAVVCGLFVNYPLTLRKPKWLKDYDSPLSTNPQSPEVIREFTRHLLDANYKKSLILIAGLSCQTLGIVFLAIAVWQILVT